MSEKSVNKELVRMYLDGDDTALENLTELNMGLVKNAARRFIGRGTDFEDLVQIGVIGLIKAARSFDLSYQYEFSTYAFTMIVGEIRRFLRDDGLITVSRGIKKNCAMLLSKKEEYVNEFGCEPSIGTLAELCGMSTEDAVMSIGALSPVLSYNGVYDDNDEEIFPLEHRIGVDLLDKEIERIALNQALDMLCEEERTLIELRYVAGLTQSKVAKRLNTTQVTVSRLEKKILAKLREYLK